MWHGAGRLYFLTVVGAQLSDGLGSRSVILGARPKDLVGGRQGWYAVSGAVLTTTGSVCSVVKK